MNQIHGCSTFLSFPGHLDISMVRARLNVLMLYRERSKSVERFISIGALHHLPLPLRPLNLSSPIP